MRFCMALPLLTVTLGCLAVYALQPLTNKVETNFSLDPTPVFFQAILLDKKGTRLWIWTLTKCMSQQIWFFMSISSLLPLLVRISCCLNLSLHIIMMTLLQWILSPQLPQNSKQVTVQHLQNPEGPLDHTISQRICRILSVGVLTFQTKLISFPLPPIYASQMEWS